MRKTRWRFSNIVGMTQCNQVTPSQSSLIRSRETSGIGLYIHWKQLVDEHSANVFAHNWIRNSPNPQKNIFPTRSVILTHTHHTLTLDNIILITHSAGWKEIILPNRSNLSCRFSKIFKELEDDRCHSPDFPDGNTSVVAEVAGRRSECEVGFQLQSISQQNSPSPHVHVWEATPFAGHWF